MIQTYALRWTQKVEPMSLPSLSQRTGDGVYKCVSQVRHSDVFTFSRVLGNCWELFLEVNILGGSIEPSPPETHLDTVMPYTVIQDLLEALLDQYLYFEDVRRADISNVLLWKHRSVVFPPPDTSNKTIFPGAKLKWPTFYAGFSC